MGFSEDPKITYVRPNDGRLLWKGSFIPGVVMFAPDELRWHKFEGAWDYPHFPEDNDDPLATDQCPEGVTEFLVRPGDGSLVYGCPDDLDAMIYHDEAGTLVYADAADDPDRHLVAAAADGVFLTRSAADDTVATLRLLPAGAQVTVPLTPPPEAAPDDRVIQARARPDDPHALWAVVTNGGNGFKRWTITTAGVASVDGLHAVIGTVSQSRLRISGDGAIVYLDDYGFAEDSTRLIRAPLVPAQAEVLYHEASAPVRVDPIQPPFVYIHEADLFTGP